MQTKETLGFLGADVSKGMCNFVLQSSLGEELETNFQLDDNKEGHKKLYELLQYFQVTHGISKVIIGLESTGGYENNWYKGLGMKSRTLGLEVYRINPKRIYHETKTEGRRSITDGVSAQVIAGYLRKNYGERDLSPQRFQSAQSKPDKFASMRSLHKYIQRLIKQNTRLKNALEKILYSTMPELLALKGEKYSNWFLELLIRYPSREDILSADIEELTLIPYLTISKAHQIYTELEQSVGSPSDAYLSIVISEQAEDIKGLQKKIARLKKQLMKLAEKEEQLEQDMAIVSSIKGIAQDTAIGYLMELGSIERFEKGKNLVAYWGINPTIKQSGDKTYYVGMSKDGSSNARAIMYMAAKNVVRSEPYFAQLYHEHRKKGKAHRSALGVVMAKLSRVLYGMLKNRKKFDSSIDVLNQNKGINKETEKKLEEARKNKKQERRYQDKQNTAPVSRTQRVKRNQEQLSQTE